MATTIENLTAVVDLQHRGFDEGMTQVERRSAQGAKTSTRHLKNIDESAKGLRGSLFKVGAAAGVVAGGYLAIGAAKSAIATTVGLAKTTVALHRNLGLTNQAASEWAASATARGVDTDSLSTSFTSLARNVKAAEGGSKTAVKTFAAMGITQKQLRGTGGDFNKVLALVAQGLGGMEGGARRAAVAQALLGRSSQTTLPIFTQGRKSMQENLELADKYGVTLGGRPLKSLRELQHAQKEMEFAQLGWQVTFATKVAPALTSLIGLVGSATVFLRDHSHAVAIAASVLGPLAAGIVAFNVAVTVMRSRLITAAAAQLGLNIAMYANPIGLVIAALVALGVGLAVAWKRSETFRAVVTGAWNGIKRAVGATADFFTGTVWPKVRSFVARVQSAFDSVRSGIVGAFTAVRNRVGDIWYGIYSTIAGWINKVIGIVNHLPGVNIGGIQIGISPAAARGARGITTHRQRGGIIPGSGDGDKVHVMAEPGEGFINKRAVQALGGKAFVDALNRGVPRFALGGVVGTAARGAANLVPGGGALAGMLGGFDVVGALRRLALPQMAGQVGQVISGLLGFAKDKVLGWAREKVASLFASFGGGASTHGLVPQVLRALAFARAHGWHGTVTSGFRTYAEQATLYARYLAGGPLAARPGTGNHETGNAVDVTDYGTFGRIMSFAPAFARLFNRLGARDPVHFSTTGFANGGWIREQIFGVGRSGRHYSFGERGPEYVSPGGSGVHIDLRGSSFNGVNERHIARDIADAIAPYLSGRPGIPRTT